MNGRAGIAKVSGQDRAGAGKNRLLLPFSLKMHRLVALGGCAYEHLLRQ
jgi:hypothetical protein